jgi:hypothetical protein
MPRKAAPPIDTIIETVARVSPDFARVAVLAQFGLRFQGMLAHHGYVPARTRKANGVVSTPVTTGPVDEL